MNSEWTVTHNTVLQRFEVRIGDQLAVLNYRRDGDHVTFNHTGVPQNLEGRASATLLRMLRWSMPKLSTSKLFHCARLCAPTSRSIRSIDRWYLEIIEAYDQQNSPLHERSY